MGLHRRGDAGGQAASAHAHDDRADVGALLEDLQPDGALPGDDVRVVERVDQHRPGPRGVLPGRDQAVVDGLAELLDLRAVPASRHQLGDRRSQRHVDLGLDAEHLRRERDALGVVAGARGDDAGRPLGLGQPGHPGVGAADLERAGPLEVLALEEDRPADQVRERPAGLQRRTPDDVLDQRSGRPRRRRRRRAAASTPCPAVFHRAWRRASHLGRNRRCGRARAHGLRTAGRPVRACGSAYRCGSEG